MAEHRVGAARFHDNFVYLQSGVKVGLGVMLGGGVGQNQLLLPEVRRTVEELAWTVEITIGALGEHATIQGAVHTAITRALDRMG